MKITLDGKYQTRDGRKVRVVAIANTSSCKYPVFAVITSKDGHEYSTLYTEDGRVCAGIESSPIDLIPVPKEYSGWQNVYLLPYGEVRTGGWADSLNEAITLQDHAPKHWRLIARLPINFTDGQGL